MSDEDAFWRAIGTACWHHDLLPVGVFADWLDERGDPRADPLRWCFVTGKTPDPTPGRLPRWHTYGYPAAAEDMPGYSISGELFGRLTLGRECPTMLRHTAGNWREYLAAQTAYQDFAIAWLACERAGIDPRTGEPLAQPEAAA